MAFCRWSCDDFKCDLYVYADCYGGYTCHVAGTKILGDIPHFQIFTDGNGELDIDKTMAAKDAQHKFLETAERAPIGLSRDGESFNVGTAEELKDLVLDLGKEGYRYPDYLIEYIDEEIAEEKQNGTS